MKKQILFIFYLIVLTASAQNVSQLKDLLSQPLSNIYSESKVQPTKLKVDSIAINHQEQTIEIYAGLPLSYIPMREEIVNSIYDSIRNYLPYQQNKYVISVFTDQQEITNLIPNFYRHTIQKDKDRVIAHEVSAPLTKNISSPIGSFSKGLQNNHIALWQSHGWYYEQKLSRWEWQRARIFQTVEDIYTQSYVVPFIVPMLENAGANVLLPRERDYNRTEIIVDNNKTVNSQSLYRETNGKTDWQDTSMPGFAHTKEFYLDGENPFKMGTARQIKTITEGKESLAEWFPAIARKDKYGVYVSYQSLDNSTEEAHYRVYHAGGETDFLVNQQMGGGTWIFLGHFTFDKEKNHRVVLSNKSNKAGEIVTADAVKIGGGMGNIARLPHPTGFEKENAKSSDKPSTQQKTLANIEFTPEVSGYPRYTEAARYWLQWAGTPDSIYNISESKNDYTDDFQSRGYWVNYIAGGSSVLPKAKGLKVPIDLAFAFHSDAGTTMNDSIIGTLGIYMTHHNDEKFENGSSRWAARDLTELIMQEITNDIRADFEPNWTRRHLWNRSYSEARVPNVPTMLLELLSHQNFADMRYGLDPAFRFTVSRAIYKGMLKFIASQYNRDYVVQPLPVQKFSSEFSGDKQIELKWEETFDEKEPTAKPTKYIVYTRIDDNDFDNGFVTSQSTVKIAIEKDKLYSFKVTAMNEGGQSFPSEILSVYRNSKEKGSVMIVNGFTRTSAPFSFSSRDSIAGFVGREDNGIPYISDHHFIGQMHEFRRSIPWMDDDSSGFGDSDANYETTAIAGNSFDYPSLHGKGFAEAGYSFVSTSAKAIEHGIVLLNKNYKIVDWILGKQREWPIARGAMMAQHKTFTKAHQQIIRDYCNSGGNIIVSGAFVGTDLWDNQFADIADKEWAEEILKYKWRNNYGSVTGRVKSVTSPFKSIEGNYNYYNELNSKSYVVENPDAIEPVGDNAYTVYRYTENNFSAGTFYKGDRYNTCILGFPIESIKDQNMRIQLIKGIVKAMEE
ncbi:MAG: xanthan lyase [Bacteroidales bacterium]|nr:xanthan lyase [Bacteroidales bacterium]